MTQGPQKCWDEVVQIHDNNRLMIDLQRLTPFILMICEEFYTGGNYSNEYTEINDINFAGLS